MRQHEATDSYGSMLRAVVAAARAPPELPASDVVESM
jgi:hypothetical protein